MRKFIEAIDPKINEVERCKAFKELADNQRGEPEMEMLRAQHALKGGVLAYCIEHIGDLTHRMAQYPEHDHYYCGHSMVKPKVDRALGMLRSTYHDRKTGLTGFQAEFMQNMHNNGEYSGMTGEEFLAQVTPYLQRYADAHKKLKTYNLAQSLAKQAAISLGELDFNDAKYRLSMLEDMLETPEKWEAAASKYNPARAIRENANPNVITVYHGDEKPNVTLHEGMFFTTCERFAADYGPHITRYELNTMNILDSLDEELIEPHLPIYDPYTDTEIETVSDYMDRSSDTWEILETDGLAEHLVSVSDAHGILIYEGGIPNYLIYNLRCIKPLLSEAPIASIDLQGPVVNNWGKDQQMPFNKGTGFSKVDQKLLSSPKGIEKVIRAFSKTPHNFEIFFVNVDHFDGDSDEANNDVDTLARRHQTGVKHEWDDIKGKEGVVRVVMMGNLSPPTQMKMPMSGWTLAHKIGHSMQDECYNSGWQTPWGEVVKKIVSTMNKIAEKATGTPYVGAGSWFHMHPDMMSLLTMKSARDGIMKSGANDFEVFAEVVAQYLISGKVTFDFSGIGNPSPDLERGMEALNGMIHDMFEELEGMVLVEL